MQKDCMLSLPFIYGRNSISAKYIYVRCLQAIESSPLGRPASFQADYRAAGKEEEGENMSPANMLMILKACPAENRTL